MFDVVVPILFILGTVIVALLVGGSVYTYLLDFQELFDRAKRIEKFLGCEEEN